MDFGGYDRFGTGTNSWGDQDDSRGFKKTRTPMQKIMRITNKGSWLLVLLLFGFVWHLHSHKQTLRQELETHKDEKDSLMSQMALTQDTLAAKHNEAEEYKKLHSQATNTANQHQTNLHKMQDELTHIQLLHSECAHDLKEERDRAAARKCEDCSPLKTQLQTEQTQKTGLQNEINHLRVQLDAVTAQLEQLKQNTIPKPVETTTQHQQGHQGGDAATAAAAAANQQQQQQRTTHDDHIDAAIAGHGQQVVPTPVVDPNQHHHHHQQDQQEHQQQEHQQQRRWGRGGARDPVAHEDEHVEPVMTPDERRLKRRGGRRKGGLSMLEEHLGVEHDEMGEDIHY